MKMNFGIARTINSILASMNKPKPMVIHTNSTAYIGVGVKTNIFSKQRVMTELHSVKKDWKQSKYMPHQGKQECQRRAARG